MVVAVGVSLWFALRVVAAVYLLGREHGTAEEVIRGSAKRRQDLATFAQMRAEVERMRLEHVKAQAYLRALEEVFQGEANVDALTTARRIVEAALGRREERA